MPLAAWETLSTREVYRNPWIRVREDIAALPNGHTTIYGVCELGQCVGVLPFVRADAVVMVRQYRYVQREAGRWEMPTGGVRPGEPLAAAAQRELMEEVGYRAGTLTPINTHYTSKSVCDETAHLYIAHDLEAVAAVPDETEFLEVAIVPFAEVLRQVLAGEIRDSMTMIAVLLAARRP
ncbi:MAG TPA: NUDIX hydrolase [Chloroflexia bacterium]|nr:NUDIX hydrolase [Chloroflexia bacterium]